MSESEILKIYNDCINSVIELVKGLNKTISELNEKISTLEERVQSLEKQTKSNSNNSSKPPSSDELKKKTKSLRQSSGKRPGGQPGHEGRTLEQVDNPDEVIIHTVEEYDKCGKSIKDEPVIRYIKRQVMDLPATKVKVTEHRAEVKKCTCGHINKASFPEGVSQPVQYGNRIKATSVYLNQYQFVPYERQEELFEDLFNHHISKGTLASINKTCYVRLESVENKY